MHCITLHYYKAPPALFSLHIKDFHLSCFKVTTDKKSLAYVDNMLKKSNKKVEELHQELQELNAHIVVKDPEELLGDYA